MSTPGRCCAVESAGDGLFSPPVILDSEAPFPGTSGPTSTAIGSAESLSAADRGRVPGAWPPMAGWRWAPYRPRTRISVAVRRIPQGSRRVGGIHPFPLRPPRGAVRLLLRQPVPRLYRRGLAAVAREVGAACGLTTESVLVDIRSDPFHWGRFNVFPWDTAPCWPQNWGVGTPGH